MSKRAKKAAAPPVAEQQKVAPVAAQARVEAVIDLLCSGVRYTQVVSMLAEKFGVTPRTIEADIKRAYDILAEEEKEERPRRKARLRAALWRICRKAEGKGGDLRAAVTALAQLAKIDGLEAPQKIEAQVTAKTVMVVPPPARSVEDWAKQAGTTPAPPKSKSKE